MKRKFKFVPILLLLLLAVSACGGGSDLTYKVLGTASEANIAYTNAQGETEEMTVVLPWETNFGIGDSFDFKISIENADDSGSVTCEVWINARKVGGTSGVRRAECSGFFSGSKNSFSTDFRGRYDAKPEDAVATMDEKDAVMATSAAAMANRRSVRLDWTIYTTGDGLVDNEVLTVAVAADGALWVGTESGVSRFDGETWTTFTEKDGLTGNKVWAIAAVPDGAVWFGTPYGVSHFDGETWTTYTKEDGLVANGVQSIAVAPDGAVWFGTRYGVSRFDGQTWTTYTEDDGLVNNTVFSIAATPDGVVWFGTYQGVSRFAYAAGGDQVWTSFTKQDGLADDQVHPVAVAADGAVWAGTYRGVSRFDGEAWTTYTEKDGLAEDAVFSIAAAPDGALWFSHRGSISRFTHSADGGDFWNIDIVPGGGLKYDSVSSIALEPGGALWLGTKGGDVYSTVIKTSIAESAPAPTATLAQPAVTATSLPSPIATPAPITDFERYEHAIDCTPFSTELQLGAFSALYPRGALIQDCQENPDNYVMFSLDPDEDTEDAAFVIALGRFNLDPPDPSKYRVEGMRFLTMVSGQIKRQLDAEELNADPLIYEGQTLYRQDFVAEVEGSQRLIRMVLVPNFEHGHGLLFFAMKRIADSPEKEMPEFDRVARQIIESVEFAPVEPRIGAITFATDVTADSEPLDPATTFPAGALQVYGVFEYADIYPGMTFGFAWRLNGEPVYSDTVTWAGDASSGRTWVNVDHDEGLASGSYELRLSVNGALLQTGSFVIEGASAAETDATAWYQQGHEHSERGDYKEAIAAFSKAIELDPNYVTAYNDRGFTHMLMGNYEQAIADYDRAIELDPSYARAYNNRGSVYSDLGNYEQAIADFDRAIELDLEPLSWNYYNRGLVYNRLGDYEQAVADYNQAIELDPGYARAFNSRGSAYKSLGDYEQAIADFNRAIELGHDRPSWPYYNRAGAWLDLGNYEQAIADYTQVISYTPQLGPGDAGTFINRGLAYARQGDYEQAIADYDQALALQPDNDIAYLNRGLAYVEQGDTERAVSDLRKVLEISNNVNVRQVAEKQLEELGIEP
jgi:tetratricopeptide (TPR) repeat protein